jgi:hypothetical protein
MYPLARALADYDLDLLLAIAGQWDVDLDAGERIQAAEALAEAILRPEAVGETWERLSPEEQAALHALQRGGGRMPYSHFARQYGEVRPMGSARREREKPWLNPVSVTEALYYRGLIARAFDQGPGGVAQEFAYVPSDLLELLPPLPAEEAQPPPGYAVAPPRIRARGAFVAPDDLTTLLAYLRLRPADAHTWLSAEPQPRIDVHLRRPQPTCRALLTHLAYELGLLEDQGSTTLVVAEAARPWLEAPRLEQLRSLAEAWRDTPTWNDLAHTPGLMPHKPGQWPNDPLLARGALLETLGRVPAEIWWSLDSFVEAMRRENPDFQRPGGDYHAWYLHDAYSGEILHGFEYWDYIEGALIRFMIEGPLSWLGLVLTGGKGFRLTDLGLALVGRAEWPSAADPAADVSMDEYGVLSVPADVSRYERFQVSRFAAWRRAPPAEAADEDGGVYLYQLTPQSIERAAAQGVTVGHILPFLRRLTGHQVPASVVNMLQAWAERGAEVTVRDMVTLTARDFGVYERMRKDETVRALLGESVGVHAHAVARDDLPALLNALRRMGILPLFEGHEGDDAP